MKIRFSLTKFALLVAVLSLSPLFAMADQPLFINYQGRLSATSGVAQDGEVSIKFRFYKGQGQDFAEERDINITVSKGVFSALIPVSASLFSENDEVYLGVTIGGGTEMSPRQRLVAAPYALAVVNNAIGTNQIRNGAVTVEKVSAINTANGLVKLDGDGKLPILDGSALTGVDADTVKGDSVDTVQIKNGAVNKDKLQDGAVTVEKVSANAINTANGLVKLDGDGKLPILDGSALTGVNADRVKEDSVDTVQIKNGAVNKDKLQDGAVTVEKVSANAINTANGLVKLDGDGKLPILDGSALTGVDADRVKEDSVDTVQIKNGAVTKDKIAASSLVSVYVAPGANHALMTTQTYRSTMCGFSEGNPLFYRCDGSCSENETSSSSCDNGQFVGEMITGGQ